MKFMVIKELNNHISNLVNRIWCFRFVTFIIMLFFFVDMNLAPFRENVRILGERGNAAVLPFLQTSDYFMKTAFLGVIYFYSNVPFREKGELFYFSRLGKRRWGWRNISYIIGSSLILTVSLFVISIIPVLSVSNVSLSWDSVYKTISLTGGSNMPFEIPYKIMREYQPWHLMFLILILDEMVILFIGMFMYAVSLCGYRVLSCVAGIVIVFMPSIDAWLGGRLVYYSPLSWLDCSNWRIGYDSAKPDLPYMVVAVIFLVVILIVFSQNRVRKMEWNTLDD